MNFGILRSLLIFPFLLTACGQDKPTSSPTPMTRVHTDRTYLRDQYGRYIFFNGMNVGGSTKIPYTVNGKVLTTKDFGQVFSIGLPSYLGRPWPDNKIEEGVRSLRDMGFNAFRLLINWEGIEPCRKGQYDKAYVSSIRKVVETANRYGIRVLLDMHQDAFSRHIAVKYNEKPSYTTSDGKLVIPEKGSIEYSLLSLIPPYTDVVRGEGAPRWAVEACLQEKKVWSKNWGVPRLISGLDDGISTIDLAKLGDLLAKLMGKKGSSEIEIPPWVLYFKQNLPKSFPVNETSDALPFTNWGIMAFLSMDVSRCFLCLFAGEKAMPTLKVTECLDPPPEIDPSTCNPEGPSNNISNCKHTRVVSVQEYLQDAYANAWRYVVSQVKDLPNIIGYDIINEPIGNFIPLTLLSGLITTGSLDGAKKIFYEMFGEQNKELGETLYNLLLALRIIPPLPEPPPKDATEEEKEEYYKKRDEILKEWGVADIDFGAIIGMNYGFDREYLKPFYERIGKEILKEDPSAVIFIEPSLNLFYFTGPGIGGFLDVSMTKPEGLPHVVYAPHYYTDIYPFIGFNESPRSFTEEEVRFREYKEEIGNALSLAQHSLGNIPSILGEFGTYFNFSGIDVSDKQGYKVSAQILDNYYESLESLFASRFLWCYTFDNDKVYGDLWNKEDFSILGYEERDDAGNIIHPRKWRGEIAWSRPYPKALAGKPLEMHFYSPLHYFDPDKGVHVPEREFFLRYGGKETSKPTEIFVPPIQYPDGFYVWVSDGYCFYDDKTYTLYHYPTNDEPLTVHTIRILPPLPHVENKGWAYFFKGSEVIQGD